MSRMKVLAVITLLLVSATAYGQYQQAQPGQSQQRGVQPGAQGMGGSSPAWNSPQAVQNLSQAVDQSKADLEKAIDTASGQAKGTVIGAAFTLHGPYTGKPAAQSTTGQGETLVAHVYVVADNQLKDVIVDAKNDKVLNVATRRMVTNPWAYREGAMGAGESGSAQSGTQGQTLRERVGMPADVSFLRLETAQQIVKLADQESVTLKKVMDAAKDEAKGGNVVGAFLLTPRQAGGTAAEPAAEKQDLHAKVFCLVNDQVKVVTMDAKTNKVIGSETRSTFISPWEGRYGSSGMGGSSGDIAPSGTHGAGQSSTGDKFPTGSSEGTGPGSLGGQ